MTTKPEHPASTHGRSLALLHHLRVGDLPAVDVLLRELDGPEAAAAQIVSLLQLCCRIIDERPEDGHAWLQAAMLRLAKAEGGDVAS